MGNTNYWKHLPGHIPLVRHEVKPGSETDVFFIPVTNLPRGFTYRDLRAITKQVASVEKCFIYPNSCEGWVRVSGLDNFKKLSKYLDGLQIDGCMLHASRMHEHENICVWDTQRTANSRVYNRLRAGPPGPLRVTVFPLGNWVAGVPELQGTPTSPVPPTPFPGYVGETGFASFVPGDAHPDGGYGGHFYSYEYGEGAPGGGGSSVGNVGSVGSTCDSGQASSAGSTIGGQQPHDKKEGEWQPQASLVVDGSFGYAIAEDKRKREEQERATLSS